MQNITQKFWKIIFISGLLFQGSFAFGQIGTWQKTTQNSPIAVSTSLLLTDGSILCQEDDGNQWARLTPDVSGSYINGTWSSVAVLTTRS